jgi:hypothetical protein
MQDGRVDLKIQCRASGPQLVALRWFCRIGTADRIDRSAVSLVSIGSRLPGLSIMS